jgi:hypothetical protein
MVDVFFTVWSNHIFYLSSELAMLWQLLSLDSRASFQLGEPQSLHHFDNHEWTLCFLSFNDQGSFLIKNTQNCHYVGT